MINYFTHVTDSFEDFGFIFQSMFTDSQYKKPTVRVYFLDQVNFLLNLSHLNHNLFL